VLYIIILEMGKVGFTIKIFLIVIIAFLVVSAWSEVIIKSISSYFDLDKEDIKTWIIFALVSSGLLLIVVIASNIEIHDLFGISETVDVQLTGLTEKFKNGKVKHVKSR
jgi:hypothetical protein